MLILKVLSCTVIFFSTVRAKCIDTDFFDKLLKSDFSDLFKLKMIREFIAFLDTPWVLEDSASTNKGFSKSFGKDTEIVKIDKRKEQSANNLITNQGNSFSGPQYLFPKRNLSSKNQAQTSSLDSQSLAKVIESICRKSKQYEKLDYIPSWNKQDSKTTLRPITKITKNPQNGKNKEEIIAKDVSGAVQINFKDFIRYLPKEMLIKLMLVNSELSTKGNNKKYPKVIPSTNDFLFSISEKSQLPKIENYQPPIKNINSERGIKDYQKYLKNKFIGYLPTWHDTKQRNKKPNDFFDIFKDGSNINSGDSDEFIIFLSDEPSNELDKIFGKKDNQGDRIRKPNLTKSWFNKKKNNKLPTVSTWSQRKKPEHKKAKLTEYDKIYQEFIKSLPGETLNKPEPDYSVIYNKETNQKRTSRKPSRIKDWFSIFQNSKLPAMPKWPINENTEPTKATQRNKLLEYDKIYQELIKSLPEETINKPDREDSVVFGKEKNLKSLAINPNFNKPWPDIFQNSKLPAVSKWSQSDKTEQHKATQKNKITDYDKIYQEFIKSMPTETLSKPEPKYSEAFGKGSNQNGPTSIFQNNKLPVVPKGPQSDKTKESKFVQANKIIYYNKIYQEIIKSLSGEMLKKPNQEISKVFDTENNQKIPAKKPSFNKDWASIFQDSKLLTMTNWPKNEKTGQSQVSQKNKIKDSGKRDSNFNFKFPVETLDKLEKKKSKKFGKESNKKPPTKVPNFTKAWSIKYLRSKGTTSRLPSLSDSKLDTIITKKPINYKKDTDQYNKKLQNQQSLEISVQDLSLKWNPLKTDASAAKMDKKNTAIRKTLVENPENIFKKIRLPKYGLNNIFNEKALGNENNKFQRNPVIDLANLFENSDFSKKSTEYKWTDKKKGDKTRPVKIVDINRWKKNSQYINPYKIGKSELNEMKQMVGVTKSKVEEQTPQSKQFGNTDILSKKSSTKTTAGNNKLKVSESDLKLLQTINRLLALYSKMVTLNPIGNYKNEMFSSGESAKHVCNVTLLEKLKALLIKFWSSYQLQNITKKKFDKSYLVKLVPIEEVINTKLSKFYSLSNRALKLEQANKGRERSALEKFVQKSIARKLLKHSEDLLTFFSTIAAKNQTKSIDDSKLDKSELGRFQSLQQSYRWSSDLPALPSRNNFQLPM